MKNILIVSYYFEPYNIVASRRPESWAKYLSGQYNVTVLTRSWTGNENGLTDIAIENKDRSDRKLNDNLEVLHIPYVRPARRNLAPNNRIFRKLTGYYKHYLGKFSDIEFIKENFENEILAVLKQKQIDLIIYTVNPYLFLPVSKSIFKITGIRYVIDFRDLLCEIMLKKRPSFKELLYQKIMAFRLKFHINKAAALITVSEPLNKILSGLFDRQVYTLYNGFNEDVFTKLMPVKENERKFNITYTGNLSLGMDISILLKGAAIFFKKCKPDAELNFIGISDDYKTKISSLDQQVKINIFNWMPYQQALELSRQSSVLVYMGWKGYTGILSGKIFDYLGLQRMILLAPSDNDVLEALVLRTGAGIIANTEIEVAEILERMYCEWKEKGHLSYKGDINKTMEFTRNNQAAKLIDIINSII